MRRLALFMMICVLPMAAHAADGLRVDGQSAVILAYHRVGDDAHPAANIRLEQFQAHLRYLKDEGFTVLPLAQLVAAVRGGQALPDKSVAITFDGAHRSILTNAVPLLDSYKFPYTVFAPSLYADDPAQDYLSWQDLKSLRDDGRATIGLQSALYTHLNSLSTEDIRRGVNNARARYREEMGTEPSFYAYPFGEISKAYRDLIEAQSFYAGFGQQSGAASPASDIYALPRFVMTESYGDLERFETAVMALPLPITGIEPADLLLTTNNPAIGFTLPPALARRDDFDCFATGAPEPTMQHLGQGRVELRFPEPITAARVRINCTLTQGTDDPERPYRWRWFGMLLTMAGTREVATDTEE